MLYATIQKKMQENFQGLSGCPRRQQQRHDHAVNTSIEMTASAAIRDVRDRRLTLGRTRPGLHELNTEFPHPLQPCVAAVGRFVPDPQY